MPATIIVAEVMDSTDYPMMNVNFDDTAGFNNNEASESELITSIDEEEILQNAEDEEDDLAVERATIVSVLDEEEYEFTTILNLEGMYIYCKNCSWLVYINARKYCNIIVAICNILGVLLQ